MLLPLQSEEEKASSYEVPPSHLTCSKLEASVDSHARPFAPPDIHGELQPTRVGVDAISEGEAQLVGAPANSFGCVNQQLVQDILVGEGGALREDSTVLQGLRVKLASAEFT